MVNIAVLMIDQTADEMPIALLEVSGEPLLYHQIMQLRKFGISRHIVAIEKVNSEALSVAANLRRDGIDIEFVSRLSALQDMIGPEDPFLMISDGIWSSDAHIENMVNAEVPEILAFQNEDILSIFERIDLNYRWSGLARLHGGLLSSIDELPEDSAVQSTLLRIALQHDCALKVIEYEASSHAKITDQTAANVLSEDKINSSKRSVDARGFFEMILFYPLAKLALRSMWKKKDAHPLIILGIEYSYLAFFAFAIVLIALNFIILSYSMAIIGCFCAFFKQLQHHIKPKDDNLFATVIVNMSICVLLIIAAIYSQNLWNIGAAIITFLLGYSIRKLYFQRYYDRLILSFSDIFLIMIMAYIMGLEIYAFTMIAISYSLWIFGGMILYQPLKKS